MEGFNLKHYNVTQYFGERPEYYAQFGLGGHPGIDLDANYSNVWAEAAGRVIFCDQAGNYGLLIKIIDLSGGCWYYGHLSEVYVEQNQSVEAGQVIAISGASGLVSGPHLHLEYRPKDIDINNGFSGAIDPLSLINGDTEMIASEEFVRKVYQSVLGREPDSDGLSYYIGRPCFLVFEEINDSVEANTYRQNLANLQLAVNNLLEQNRQLQSQIDELSKRPTIDQYNQIIQELENIKLQISKQQSKKHTTKSKK